MDWKKIAINCFLAIAVLAIIGYSLLFTRVGNVMVFSCGEFFIKTNPKVPIDIEKFSTLTNNVNLLDTTLGGKFSLLRGKFGVDYNMRVIKVSRICIV